jgi:hypothetical protein
LVEAGLLTHYQVEQVLAGRAAGLLLGPYRILERLGGGGMGQVYKAEHRLMKRVVALKVIGRRAARRRATGKRVVLPKAFRREVEAAGRLNHPHIVLAHDAAVAHGIPFLVMEYVDGTDLGRLVAESGPLPVPLACEAVRQAALALHYAWERGILHRDVKPSNLLLARQPLEEGVLVKLLDLGLARWTGRSRPDGDRRGSGLAGTPDYLAPERWHAQCPADVRGDLYSLGCTFYHLLTGQAPYPDGGWTEKLLRHRFDPVPSVRALRPEVPEALAAVVRNLMAKEPNDRYPTPAALATVLEGLTPLASVGLPSAADPRATPCLDLDTPEDGGALASSALAIPELAPARPAAEPIRSWGRWPVALLTAALSGTLLAAAARCLPVLWKEEAPAAAPGPAPRAAAAVAFTVAGRPGTFATLAEAVAAAPDGGTVIVQGDAPIPTPALRCRGKALIVQAAPGSRPSLERAPSAADPPWLGLLDSDQALTLRGLELRDPAGRGPLVRVEGAELRLTDCRLQAAGRAAAIVQRQGRALTLHKCRIEADALGLSVEVGGSDGCRVRLEGNRLLTRGPSGAALALWSAEVCEPTPVEVRLTDNHLEAGRIVALRRLPARLTLRTEGNTLVFREAVLSFTGYVWEDAWRPRTAWQGRANHYQAAGAWLRSDGRALPVRDLAGWKAFWEVDEPLSDAPDS